MKLVITALAVSLAAAGPMPLASAQTTDGCADLGTQSGQNECGGTALMLADGALQAAYDRLRAGYSPEQRERLRDAQRAWISYRDNWCAYESMSVENGSMHPSVISACLQRLTEDQTKRIVYQLTCTGDVDCVGR